MENILFNFVQDLQCVEPINMWMIFFIVVLDYLSCNFVAFEVFNEKKYKVWIYKQYGKD